MTGHPVHVAIDASLFMLAHLVGHDTSRIVDLRVSGRARRTADVFPTRAAVAAARYTSLFDANDDFVSHSPVKYDGTGMGYVGPRRKRPPVVVRQLTKSRKFAERPAAVFT